ASRVVLEQPGAGLALPGLERTGGLRPPAVGIGGLEGDAFAGSRRVDQVARSVRGAWLHQLEGPPGADVPQEVGERVQPPTGFVPEPCTRAGGERLERRRTLEIPVREVVLRGRRHRSASLPRSAAPFGRRNGPEVRYAANAWDADISSVPWCEEAVLHASVGAVRHHRSRPHMDPAEGRYRARQRRDGARHRYRRRGPSSRAGRL